MSATMTSRRAALADLRRPGGAELAAVVLAAVVLAAAALAGGTRAAGRVPGSGVALAVDAAAAAGGKTTVHLTVANGSKQPFEGRVIATGKRGERRAAVDLDAGRSESYELDVPAACGTTVSIVLEGPDGALRRATAMAPCGGGGG